MANKFSNIPTLTYRADIDGLRALAIISVIIFHVFPHSLHGGFTGVDIFFVISGYLITGHILKEQDDKKFSLINFYNRRIKRIFPALLAVLFFSASAGYFILLGAEYKELGKHIAAGTAYVSNIILKNEAGYFDTATELKPLIHLWSLAIEEQFYFIWPLILIITRRINANRFFIILISLLISFSINIFNIQNLPINTFYLPFYRFWELLIGSAIAYANLYYQIEINKYLNKIFIRINNICLNFSDLLSYFGIGLVLFSLVFITKTDQFPGWWSLFPTFGAAFLILAGRTAHFNNRILSSKFMIFIGLISYPLYLWHWPLLSFARIAEATVPTNTVKFGVIIMSLFLSWLTYKFIEQPIRKQRNSKTVLFLFISSVAIGFLGYNIFLNNGYPNRYPQNEYLNQNLGARSWSQKNLKTGAECLDKFFKNIDYCMISDPKTNPTVILLGDSNANHFYPGLASTLTSENLLNIGNGYCPPLLNIDVITKEGDQNCNKHAEQFFSLAINLRSIKTVILSMLGEAYLIGYRDLGSSPDNFVKTNSLRNPHFTNAEILEDSLFSTFSLLTEAKKNVIFIISVPMLDFDPASCVDARPWKISSSKKRSPCAMLQSKTAIHLDEYKKIIYKVAKKFPIVKIWDTTKELCDGTYCWAMKDGEMLYRDSVHLSTVGSKYVSERLLKQSEHQ